MKVLLKQKTFILGSVSLLLALVIAVGMSVWNKPIKVFQNMEKALQKQDSEKFGECFLEEDREEAVFDFQVMNSLEEYGLNAGNKLHIISGDVTENEDGSLTVAMYLLVNRDGYCQQISGSQEIISIVDGKQYMNY